MTDTAILLTLIEVKGEIEAQLLLRFNTPLMKSFIKLTKLINELESELRTNL